MVSLFELPGSRGGSDLPVDLVTPGTRGVSLLEFFAVNEPEPAPAAPPPEPAVAPDEPRSQRAEQEQAMARAAMIDAAREQASTETRAQCEATFEARLAEERTRVTRACDEFARDRQRYFASAEVQVIRLALAIARRILAREVEQDALHLLPTVRAALTRVQDGSTSSMRVAPQELAAWQATFASDTTVEVLADDQVPPGECTLDTSVGRVELGLRPQMEEIERGFNDLMQRGAA